MKKLIVILFLISGLTVSADMGTPYLQAVCKITTSDGKTYEGFVSLIIGGLHGIHKNGFYLYQDSIYNWTVLFDLNFKQLEKTGDCKYVINNFSPNNVKNIYFLSYMKYTGDYWLKETKEPIMDSTGFYLNTKTLIQRKYKIDTTICLYTELSKYLYVDNRVNKDLNRIEIPMNDIVKFEIVLEPSEKWLTEIEQKRKICYEEVFTDNSTMDYLEPLWFHEIIKDEKTFLYWKDIYEKLYRE